MIAYIPARLASSRFPRKILAEINGKPMVSLVALQASKCNYFEYVQVLADSYEVADAIADLENHKIICDVKTNGSCGTDRTFRHRDKTGNIDPFTVIQADNPDLTYHDLNSFMANVVANKCAMVNTMACPMDKQLAMLPQNVKVVTDDNSQALYFSRAPIPYEAATYYKHIGIYVFNNSVLWHHTRSLRKSSNNLIMSEDLEQLAWMAHGVPIRVVKIAHYLRSIDTPDDLKEFVTTQ